MLNFLTELSSLKPFKEVMPFTIDDDLLPVEYHLCSGFKASSEREAQKMAEQHKVDLIDFVCEYNNIDKNILSQKKDSHQKMRAR